MKNNIKIVSRNSQLALWQANWIKHLLHSAHPNINITINAIASTGDKLTQQPIHTIGGKNIFIKELQSQLLLEQADIAVHCIKDMSVFPTEGLTTSCIPVRANASDTIITQNATGLESLPQHATIGTGSPRRACLLKTIRPDIIITPIRGNIDSRLRKLDAGDYDAIMLAHAGLERLNLSTRITQTLNPYQFTPAIGQGALGLEHRSDDHFIAKLIAPLNDPTSFSCVQAEQMVNRVLKGDCHSCIGAYATIENDEMLLQAMVGDPDTGTIIRAEKREKKENHTQLGEQVVAELINQDALTILNQAGH
jgi:hydroxymethylbilane synthase